MKKGEDSSNCHSHDFAEQFRPAHRSRREALCPAPAIADDALLPAGDRRVATFIRASETYRSRLLSAAKRLAPSTEDAEDMVQDALLKAFRKLSQFRNESRMETWLYKITQNAARENLRRMRKRNDISLEQPRSDEEGPLVSDIADPGKDPEERYLLAEMQDILLHEVEALGPKCKQAFLLCMIEEFPQRAVAKQLKVRLATIKARIFHGKQTLKRAIRLRHHQGFAKAKPFGHNRKKQRTNW